MKPLLLAALLALASPAALAQEAVVGTTASDKNDNTLVVELPEEGAAAWQRVARVLADRGYPFAHTDINLLALTTAFNPIGRTASLSVSALVRGHQVILRGRLEGITAVGSAGQLVAVRRGGAVGGQRECWQELELIARALGGPVRYAQLQVR